MPTTLEVVRRRRCSTGPEGPRSAFGFKPTNMRPVLLVAFGPPTPTVELT